MKKKSKQENLVHSQEDPVENKEVFSEFNCWTGEDFMGSLDSTKHPNDMSEEEFEKYWAWYNAELPGLPSDNDLVDE
jgi:hypothetical protein|tara:strand:+ start:1082 stop:1312 length:231 start_codon:yes stop_codon:yes gene_type:complete